MDNPVRPLPPPPPTHPPFSKPLEPVQSRAPSILLGNLLPLALSTLLLALTRLLNKPTWPDLALLLGWLFALGTSLNACLAILHGAGLHAWDVAPGAAEPARQLAYASPLLYQASLGATKLAIVGFYARAWGAGRRERWEISALGAFVLATTVASEVVAICACAPVWKFWRPETAGSCRDAGVALWTSLACDLASDLWIMAFAVPRVWRLPGPVAQKVGLSVALGLGWLVVVAGTVRAVRISRVLRGSRDATWDGYDTSIWGAVEVNVAILCAATPGLRPVLTRFVPDAGAGRGPRSLPPSSVGKLSRSLESAWVRGSQQAGCFELGRSDDGMPMGAGSQWVSAGMMRIWVGGERRAVRDDDVLVLGMDEIWKSTEVRIVRDGSPGSMV